MSTCSELTVLAAASDQYILIGFVLIDYCCAIFNQGARYGQNPVGNMAAMFVFY